MLGGVVLLLGLAWALSRGAETLPDEPDDSPDVGLPEGRLLRSDDIDRLRFRVGFRGYRMSDVDAALEAARLALEAAERKPADRVVRAPGRRVSDSSEPTEQPPASAERPLSEMEAEQAAEDRTS